MNDMRGHNQPTSPLDRVAELVAAVNDGMVASIEGDEVAGRFQGFVDQLRECKADIEKAKKTESAPHNNALKKVRAKYADAIVLLDMARGRVQPLLDSWLARKQIKAENHVAERREAAAVAQAEADRLRFLAERDGATLQDQLAAKRAQEHADELTEQADAPVEKARIKGEWSDKAMSLHSYWHADITDPVKAAASYYDRAEVQDAIKRAASADARRFKDPSKAPPGVQFVEDRRAQ